MLTKKDKLLIRPWIDQKYVAHRIKVTSAGPAIDFKAPTVYPHVNLKLKKVQREHERKEQIGKENIRLLQRLGAIMKIRRIENFWQQKRPDFLNRELLYDGKKSKSSLATPDKIQNTPETNSELKGTYARCTACNSNISFKRNQVVPEPRIPFPPVKKTINKKLLFSSMAKPHQCCKFCC